MHATVTSASLQHFPAYCHACLQNVRVLQKSLVGLGHLVATYSSRDGYRVTAATFACTDCHQQDVLPNALPAWTIAWTCTVILMFFMSYVKLVLLFGVTSCRFQSA